MNQSPKPQSREDLIEQFKNLPKAEQDKLKNELILRPLESAEELQAWIYMFFDIHFPMGVVHPDSTHGPIDAMWRIYQLMKTGDSQYAPNVAMLASRDSYKTLSAAALEVLCMIHFRIPIAHMAAIKAQSAKAIQYVNGFFRKTRPYLEYHGWRKQSDSKTYIEWLTEKQETVYLNIVTATIAGANSEHVPMLFIDEVDVVQDPRALKEAKMIPSVYKNYFPLTIYLSTRKFAGGLMEKTLKEVKSAGGEILRWNILDVCERVTHEQAEIDKPKKVRYVSRNLPMEILTEEEWEGIPTETQIKFERIEAYAGIADHPMLPIMHNRLVDRPQTDTGHLYKPLVAVHNNFKTTPPDMGEAQLLCNKPSSTGLVYPRFESDKNILSVSQALSKLMGTKTDIKNFEYLKDYLKNLGVPIIGGGDWGYTDYTSLVIIALLPGGHAWLLHTFVMPELELHDIVKYGRQLQEDWGVDKWYVDQNYPSYLATLRRSPNDKEQPGAGWKIPKFKKEVSTGITNLQGKVVDSSNVRRFYVIDTPDNQQAIKAFGEYRWALDGKGEPKEGVPYHDSDGVSDIMDSIRYPAQNRFGKSKRPYATASGEETAKSKLQATINKSTPSEAAKTVNNEIMKNKIQELATSGTGVKKKGKIFWG